MGTLSDPCSWHLRVDIGQTVIQVLHFYDTVNLQSGSSISSWLFILFYPVHYFNCSESVNYLPPMATVNFICYYKHWLLMATGQSLQWRVWADQLQVLFPEQAKCYAEHAQQQKIYFSGNNPSTWHILPHRSFISLKSKLFNHYLAEKWQ